MAAVNNWLGFSLSQQELPPSGAVSADVSGADVCFNIPQGKYRYTQSHRWLTASKSSTGLLVKW
jgi:hypothetical protein